MPASVSLSGLSWSTPDGLIVFSDIDFHADTGRTGIVGRNGAGKSTLLRLICGDLVPQAGTITLCGTVGMMRQIVQPDPDETVADLFGVSGALAVLRRADAGLADIGELASADWTLEERLEQALAVTRLDLAPETRLAQLSGGQHTRLALAALVFKNPDILLLDEPTNHLDRDGRKAVIDFLSGWKGCAIVVSHDRELLETMDVIAEAGPGGVTRYGGNWSHYRALKALELAGVQRNLADAEKVAADVARMVQLRAERQARKDSAGRKKRAKGDAPRILMDARKERAEATGGNNARLAGDRMENAASALAAARQKLEVLQPFGVALPSSDLPAGRTVLAFDHVTFGYDKNAPVVRDLSFTITGPERVALTGANGSGKTTVLNLASGALQPLSGQVHRPVRAVMLDQQVSIMDPAISVLENFRRLNPESDDNACRASLARFMFRAGAALQMTGMLSGGQLLRAGLACVLGGTALPSLLILDEPTNHLDIDSTEAVEAGLRAWDGALLVVSHDVAFLEAIGIGRYQPLPITTPAASTREPPSTT